MAKKVANRGAIIIVLLLVAVLRGTDAFAADDASEYIYGFRKDNQFSLLLSFAKHEWQLREEDFSAYSGAAHFVYRFQLQLVKNFGYYLGTRLGVRYSFPAARSNFYTLLLPGATAGIVWYINSRWQALAGLEAYLERLPQLPTHDGELRGLSLATVAVVLTVEHYFDLKTAIVASFAGDMLPYQVTHGRNEHAADLQRYGWRASLGINYHLL